MCTVSHAKLRKKLVTKKRFWKINAIQPEIKARREEREAFVTAEMVRRSALATLAPARTRSRSSCLASDKVDYHISPNCKEREFLTGIPPQR